MGQSAIKLKSASEARDNALAPKRQDNQGNDIIDIVLKEVESDVLGGGRVGQAVLKTTDAGRRLVG